MKTIILLITILFTMNLNAQWYSTQFGVTDMNDLNQNQLNIGLEQSLKTIKTGQVLTGVGAVAGIIGTVIYSRGINDIISSTSTSQIDDGLNKGMGGAFLMYGGFLTMSVGIPVWIVGVQRKNTITMHLGKYESTSYIPSVGFKMLF